MRKSKKKIKVRKLLRQCRTKAEVELWCRTVRNKEVKFIWDKMIIVCKENIKLSEDFNKASEKIRNLTRDMKKPTTLEVVLRGKLSCLRWHYKAMKRVLDESGLVYDAYIDDEVLNDPYNPDRPLVRNELQVSH